MNLSITDIKWKIDRLKTLLDSKRAEYEIFGKTSEDTVADIKIKTEIEELEEELESLSKTSDF